MKAKRYISIMGMATALLLCLGSCVKYDLHSTSGTDPDPDPGTTTGTVTITADWTNRGDGVEVPTSWTVSLDDVYTGTETGETHTPDYLFEAGSYTLVAYNIPENITVSGTTATVDADDNNTSYINGTPGWLFTSVQEVNIEADTNNELTAVMQQQVRELTLVLTPTGDAAELIESIEGSLSGVASTLNFDTNTHGTSSEVALSFTQITEGDDAGKWSVTVRLLGIVESDEQTLTATISYTGGNPQDSLIESDLTTDLEDFNANKTEPLTLTGNLVETPDGTGFSGSIDGWNEVDRGSVDANIQ